jgi:hypothetical protein
MTWTIVFANRPDFEAFVKKLPDEHQEAVAEALAVELAKCGPEICKRSLGKALGGKLYEMRLRRKPEMLLRIFFGVHKNRVVVVLGGYDKKSDPSERCQTKEIRDARNVFDDWRAKNTSEKR